MKIMKFFLLAAAAVAAISCAKELSPIENENPTLEVELVPMTFTASHDAGDDAETKVAYENGATVWKVGDKIMVISATGTATEFEATEVTNGGKSATFEGLAEKSETYYAVSPASAYVGNDVANGKIYANIPQEQTAVAGSFDPKAFLSVASNEGSELFFKNSTAVIGFTFENPANVKSVRFTATGQTNIAGTGMVKTDAIPTHNWDGTYAGKSAYSMITLNAPEGGFIADTEYYIAIRANKCPDGITVYVEYNDQVKSRTSKNTLFPDGSMNRVRSLGVLDKNLTDITPYDSYQLGFDLVVAGKVINKATYGEATLVNESMTLNNTGVYFVNSGVENVSMPAKIYDKDTYIIGNGSTRADVKLSGTVQWKANTLAFKNINLVDDYSGDLMKPNAANGSILFEDCALTTDSEKSQLIYSNTTVVNISFINCDIKVAASSKDILKMGANGVVTNLYLYNNIFYSVEENGAASFKVVNNGSKVENLTLDQNTFANVYPASNYILLTSVVSYTVTNNLFYLDKYDAVYGNPYSNILSCQPTSYVADNNYLYKDINNTRLKIYNGGAYTLYTATKANVVTGEVDLTVPTIVPATTAGATR